MDADSAIVTVEFEDEEFQDLLDDLLKEIELQNYKVLKVANVDNIKERTGIAKDINIVYQYYKIVEFCNLFTCSEMASADARAGVFLPQRFAMYQRLDEDTIYVSYLRPTAIAELLDSGQMMVAARQIEREMNDIIEAVED